MASGERGGSPRHESPKGVVALPFASEFESGHGYERERERERKWEGKGRWKINRSVRTSRAVK